MLILQTKRIFVGLHELQNISADTRIHSIKDMLLCMNLALLSVEANDMMASNLSGRRNGLSIQIPSEERMC